MNEHERPVVTEVNKTAVRAGSTGHKVRRTNPLRGVGAAPPFRVLRSTSWLT